MAAAGWKRPHELRDISRRLRWQRPGFLRMAHEPAVEFVGIGVNGGPTWSRRIAVYRKSPFFLPADNGTDVAS